MFHARILSLLFLGILSAIPAHGRERASPVQAPAPIDLVFDIDWTLTSEVPPETPVGGGVIEVEGKKYRIMEGVEAVLNGLRSHPHVRISFFSGGKLTRNQSLLKKIILDPTTGLSAFDIAHRVLSFDDLVDLHPDLPAGTKMGFSERRRKRLAGFFPDLSRTLLIDDDSRFSASGEEKSLLWIGETYRSFDDYAKAHLARLQGDDAKFIPRDRIAWIFDRYRIPIVGTALEDAIREDRSGSGRVPFNEIAQKRATLSRSAALAHWRERFPLPTGHCTSFLAPLMRSP